LRISSGPLEVLYGQNLKANPSPDAQMRRRPKGFCFQIQWSLTCLADRFTPLTRTAAMGSVGLRRPKAAGVAAARPNAFPTGFQAQRASLRQLDSEWGEAVGAWANVCHDACKKVVLMGPVISWPMRRNNWRNLIRHGLKRVISGCLAVQLHALAQPADVSLASVAGSRFRSPIFALGAAHTRPPCWPFPLPPPQWRLSPLPTTAVPNVAGPALNHVESGPESEP